MALLKAKDGLGLGGGGKALSVFAGEARKPIAFAIFCEADNSLTFYAAYSSLPKAGDSYNNKTVTDIYTGFDTDVYPNNSSVPWHSVRSDILSVSFDNSFAIIRPVSTAFWFYYFGNCTEIKLDYLNTKSVTDMSYMFYYCSGITNLDVSKFDTSNVTSMQDMFFYCNGLTSLDVSKFDTSNVTDMQDMFFFCNGLTSLDVSKFDTSNVTDMQDMFYYCRKMITIYAAQNQFNIDKVTTSNYMFSGCNALVGGNGTMYDSSKVDASMAHVDVSSNPGYFTAK